MSMSANVFECVWKCVRGSVRLSGIARVTEWTVSINVLVSERVSLHEWKIDRESVSVNMCVTVRVSHIYECE